MYAIAGKIQCCLLHIHKKLKPLQVIYIYISRPSFWLLAVHREGVKGAISPTRREKQIKNGEMRVREKLKKRKRVKKKKEKLEYIGKFY